ncbi:MAG: PilZ domain-containing protein [Nannocystis sp.]|nr:PilZ domain-containing protein [Nannocystis sp.]MBA3549668.1 PilZ domain-containing protein [Nannocystis sp.]
MQERFACDFDVELETSRGRVLGRGRDMSDSAVCLTANSPVEPGTQVQVHLRLVLEWGASEAIVVPGQVAWLTDTEGLQQIGVVFSILAPELRQRLSVLNRVLSGQISLPPPGN